MTPAGTPAEGTAAASPVVQVGTPGVTPLSHRGREKLHWPPEVWQRLDRVVAEESQRTKVGRRFLHVHRVPEHTTAVPAEIVNPPSPVGATVLAAGATTAVVAGAAAASPTLQRWSPPQSPPTVVNTFAVDEGQEIRVLEIWAEFSLTPQQVEHEGNLPHGTGNGTSPEPHAPAASGDQAHGRDHHAAAGLARRAAQVLSEAEDMLIFNGLGAFSTPLFSTYIRYRQSALPTDWGLLDVVPPLASPPPIGALPAAQVIQVPLFANNAANTSQRNVYGNQTFGKVASGYARLIANAQAGPFALTLHNVPYADSFAPLEDTLIMPADRIAPLMTAGFYDSGTVDAPGYVALELGLEAAEGLTTAAAQQKAAAAAATYLVNYTSNLERIAATAANAAFVVSGAAMTAQGYKPTAPQEGYGQTAAFNAATALNTAKAGTLTVPAAANEIATGAPALPSFYGSLVSLGGQTVDLVVGIEPTVAYMQQDVEGNHRFRVVERVALRPRDVGAFIRLEFV
jgi:hypothetical protein